MIDDSLQEAGVEGLKDFGSQQPLIDTSHLLRESLEVRYIYPVLQRRRTSRVMRYA